MNSYRVLKLQSGEEIIAKVKGREKGRIILDCPMIFKTTTKNDMFGQASEVTFLKDWLSNTTSNSIGIPENFIISWLKPSNNVTRLYDIERNIKQNGYGSKKETMKPFPKPPSQTNHKNPPNNINFEELLKNIDEMKKDLDHSDTDSLDDKTFFMHMMIPPDMVKDLFENGLLEDIIDSHIDDVDDMDFFNEEINEEKYTGDEEDHPNYGNRWTDWNPDPLDEDYL